MDLSIDIAFPHASCDKLIVLSSEVEDEDHFLFHFSSPYKTCGALNGLRVIILNFRIALYYSLCLHRISHFEEACDIRPCDIVAIHTVFL